MPRGNDTEGHPTTIEVFYKEYPSFFLGPMLLAGLLYGATKIPVVQELIASKDMQSWGVGPALHYTVFAVILSYAVHGWIVTHANDKRKVQSSKKYQVSPQAMAVRSTAAILTSMVYAWLPLAPSATSVPEFVVWTFAFTLYWDFHFYVFHRFAHENKWAYRFFHKTHHLCKQPNCFGAYFVTYQSHVLLEQIVVIMAAIAGLPKNVFVFSLYWGTFGTFLEHCGYEEGNIKLPFLPLSFGRLCSFISFSGLLFEGINVAEHDWHHEKFFHNYALSFRYLDKLFGTYHPGREPGADCSDSPEADLASTDNSSNDDNSDNDSKSSTVPTATYTELRNATVDDFIKQGKAFDVYAEEGRIVDNILGLVENMKGENGEVGAMVDMYTHSLQTATRARRLGADVETIVCALLHDIGEVLSGTNHGEIPAAILRPYISPQNHWVLANHEVRTYDTSFWCFIFSPFIRQTNHFLLLIPLYRSFRLTTFSTNAVETKICATRLSLTRSKESSKDTPFTMRALNSVSTTTSPALIQTTRVTVWNRSVLSSSKSCRANPFGGKTRPERTWIVRLAWPLAIRSKSVVTSEQQTGVQCVRVLGARCKLQLQHGRRYHTIQYISKKIR